MDIDEALRIARGHIDSDNLQMAEEVLLGVLKTHPNNATALTMLGIVYYFLKDYDSAIGYSKKALNFSPTNAYIFYNLGNAYKAKKQIDEAISCYQKALQYDPKLADAYINLGVFYGERRKFVESTKHFEKALQLNPADHFAYRGIASNFFELKQLQEAKKYYKKSLNLFPNDADVHNNIGVILVNQGKIKEGISYFKKALKLNPNHTEAFLNSVDKQRLSHDESMELLNLAEQMITKDMSENDLIHVYFAMGRLCNNLKMFEKAFEYYRLGNKLKRSQVEFSIDAHIEYISRIEETFSDDFISHRKSWGSDSEMPVFIFGMPRSGTTLVEQILASHPDVYGGGELQFFTQMDERLPAILKINEPYPECVHSLDDQAAHELAESYLLETRKLAGPSKDYTRITDKNPFNFYHLGLISLLFPKASLIHCQRYPLDTCISIYFQLFSRGNHFTYDLRELEQYYRAYLNLMDHLRKVLPIRIFELRYEDLVQQQEEVSRRLVEFCGLQWDPACLDFHRKGWPIFTASDWQVRQPMYTSSCGRWQNYEQFLAPLKEALADFI